MRAKCSLVFSVVAAVMVALCSCANKKTVTTTATDLTTPVAKYYYYDACKDLENNSYADGFLKMWFANSVSSSAGSKVVIGQMYNGLNNSDLEEKYLYEAYKQDVAGCWRDYCNFLYRKWYEQTDPQQSKQIIRNFQKVLADIVNALPDDDSAWELYSLVCVVDNEAYDSRNAIRALENLERLNGVSTNLTQKKCEVYEHIGKYDKSRQTIANYLSRYDGSMQLYARTALTYIKEHNFKKALAAIQTEERQHPQNPYNALNYALYYLLSPTSAKMDSEQKTSLCYQYACSSLTMPGWELSDKLQLINFDRSDMYSFAFAVSGDNKCEYYERLSSVHDDYPMIYKRLTDCKISSGDTIAAEQIIRKRADEFADSDPDVWDDWFDLVSKRDSVDNQETEYVIRRAYQATEGKQIKWCYWMANLMIFNRDIDSTIIIINQAVQLPNSKISVYYKSLMTILGDIYTERQILDSAFNCYEQVLELYPKDDYVLNNYAYLLATNGGDLRRAERMSRLSLENNDNNATYLDTYAWILHLQGDDILARFYIEKAMRNIPEGMDNSVFKEHYEQIVKPN